MVPNLFCPYRGVTLDRLSSRSLRTYYAPGMAAVPSPYALLDYTLRSRDTCTADTYGAVRICCGMVTAHRPVLLTPISDQGDEVRHIRPHLWQLRSHVRLRCRVLRTRRDSMDSDLITCCHLTLMLACALSDNIGTVVLPSNALRPSLAGGRQCAGNIGAASMEKHFL